MTACRLPALLLLLSLLPALPGFASVPAAPPLIQSHADRPTDYCSGDFRRLLIRMAKAHKGDLSAPRDLRNLSGWLDLIKLVETRPCAARRLKDGARIWRERYPDHPATGYFPGLFGTAQPLPSAPATASDLALLVPLNGQHARFGRQLAKGARDAADMTGTTLRIYDTSTADLGWTVRQARKNRATCIIGPLRKDKVRLMAALSPGIPVLALNYLPDGQPAPAGLYQMALTPEDEGRALAELLDGLGFSTGVLLYPRGWDWAERIATRFSAAWKQAGGRLVDTAAYDPGHTDFTSPIKRLLGIHMVERRDPKTGKIRKATPRRRTDIDFIVLLADYRLGRMLHPQLRFWYSGGLPVFASSHILDGRREGIHYDLEGVRPVMPAWLAGAAAAGRSPWDAAAYFLGGSAVRIATASRCLSRERLGGSSPDSDAWQLDPVSGRFHYRSRAAVISRGRLRFTDR